MRVSNSTRARAVVWAACFLGLILASCQQPLSLQKGAAGLSGVARALVSQAGANPIVFDQIATTDNLVVLMAAGSNHNSELVVEDWGYPKHAFVNNFGQRTGDNLNWSVSLNTGAVYHVWALMNTGGVIPFKLTDGSNVLNFSTAGIGWDKVDCGTIALPAGTSTLTFVKNDTNSANWAEIKSLELIRESDKPAYLARVAGFRADTTWFANAKYGLMFQYGAWGYPQTGTTRKSLAQGAADFNVANFVNMVKSTGASYVIWSATWWQYWMQAPLTSVNTIMGNSTLTESSRDLIGDVAAALHAAGIKFMLYYHQGIQQEPTWAAKQNWPASFQMTGTGDKSTFFNNWVNVITEMGNRYGSNLDGWFFDDGLIYYPAPFERLGAAARAGNPNRLVSFNDFIWSRFTEFQDVSFGENTTGGVTTGSAPVGGNGIFTAGPRAGLLQHGMYRMEDDWGIHNPNQTITTLVSAANAISWVQSAIPRRVPLSFNLEMWEDGTVSSSSLAVLAAVKAAVFGGMVNDTDSGLTYTGTWSYSSNRGAGDYSNDVHYTRTVGNSFSSSFTGTGISVVMPRDPGQGNVDIYLDNVLKTTVNTAAPSYQAQQTIYSTSGLASGSHTLKVVMKDGLYMQLDALIISTALPTTLNDNDPAAVYTGSWSVSSGRGMGDLSNDVHYTLANNDSCAFTFTGTGVTFLTEKYSDEGNVAVYLDGVLQTTVNCSNPTRLVQQPVYSVSGLTQGSHTVKLVKTSGTYLLVDGFTVVP